ncbi:leucine-rich repeat domain-containing protein [Flavobacteriales bacterium]|nr:leucine-rich repeat domain-containing protein [Flavobacteriales bacterium]
MKKLILILICLPMIGFGQKTYVPDDNFENYLEANGMGDGMALNDSVFTGVISTVVALWVDNQNIADLTGIEDFTSLVSLIMEDNQLTSLDVSQNLMLQEVWTENNQLTSLNVSNNTALTYLICYNNQLTTLDVSQNTALTSLYCSGNQLTTLDVSLNLALEDLFCSGNGLTTLDVSNNTDLIRLNCQGNPLTTLDVSQNTALINLECGFNQLTSLDARNGNNINTTLFSCINNPSLTCINVDDSTYSANNWNLTDPQHYFSTNCCVSDTSYTNRTECDAFTWNGTTYTSSGTYIYSTTSANGCDSTAILNLTIMSSTASVNAVTACNYYWWDGVTYTTSGLYTNIYTNTLGCDSTATLNLTINISPTILVSPDTATICLGESISLTGSVAGGMPPYTYMWYGGGPLLGSNDSVTVSPITSTIYSVWVTDAALCNTIDTIVILVTPTPIANFNSTTLQCEGDTTLFTNLSIGSSSYYWDMGGLGSYVASTTNTSANPMFVYNNAGFYTITLAVTDSNGCTSIPVAAQTSIILCVPQTGTPDNNFESYLEANGMGNGILGDDSVSTINISSVVNLNVGGQNISDLTGIEDFASLQYLDCSNNNLTDLNVSNNTQLSNLQCEANILSTLSFDVTLTSLDCFDNQLTTLDLSNNPNLIFLNCSYNNLTEINVQNGYNSLLNNPNFMGNDCSCIKVDDEDDADDDWILLDDWSSYGSSSTAPSSWDCINNECIGQCTGTGEYTSLTACQDSCSLVSTIVDMNPNNTNRLLKIVDVLGRNSHQNNKTILFYLYDDGTVEKRIIIE